MSDVAKFVRHAMNRKSPEDHPDENLLSAFSEGRLPQREQDQLLAHLSECSQCREIVAFSMPEGSQLAQASPVSMRQRLRWPVLRWAGAIAAVVIVATAVLLQKSRVVEQSTPQVATYQEKNQPSSPATKTSPQLMDRIASGDRAKEEVRMSGAKTEVNKRAAIRKDEAKIADKKTANEFDVDKAKAQELSKALPGPTPSADSKQASAKTGLGLGDQSREENQESQMRAQTRDAARLPQMQSNSQNYTVAQEHVAVADVTPNVQTEPVQARTSGANALKIDQQQNAAAPSSSALANSNVAVGGPVINNQTQQESSNSNQRQDSVSETVTVQNNEISGKLVRQPQSSAVTGAPLRKASNTASVHWRLSPGGAVERSIDAGHSWHGVAVTKNSPTFRSLSVVGPDIWAAGSGGALYHSSNAGATWVSVTIKSEDVILADDITRVEFTDAQHGSVTAASGAVWMTTDAGATWSIRH